MTFQSFHFFLFLPLITCLAWILRSRTSAKKSLLLVASYYFYSAWDWRFCGLLVFLTLLNFWSGRAIARANDHRIRQAFLIVAIVGSIGVLAFFKYAGFFAQELMTLLNRMGFLSDGSSLRIVLPLGISFFTFQSLSYVLDIYRRQGEECLDLRDYALFVAFFPTVLAGPITRAKDFFPQLRSMANRQSVCEMDEGLALVVRGFVKKIAFADVLAVQLVAPAFSDPSAYSSGYLWLALYAYSFQIYMDVSGYTDIARGTAQLCGFRLPVNFDRPYWASSVSNFWQRWHMSMSGFFRDYLYFGLGGTKRGNVYVNLMLTFVAIGVWHGAGWNFLVYGGLHGAIVCWDRWRRKHQSVSLATQSPPLWAISLLAIALTFHFVVLSRVLFRAADLGSASTYVQRMVSWEGGLFPVNLLAWAALAGAATLHWVFPRAGGIFVSTMSQVAMPIKVAILVAFVYGLIALSPGSAPFVYFQF